jgi:DNA mismatch repair protein PMS2
VGRSNNERQFTYLNGRPVDLPRLHKAVNEVWRAYELGHKPAFALDLQLPPGAFDVNVTPDKREALLVGEANLVSRLKAALHSAWEESRRTFPAAPLLTTATLDSFASAAPLLPAASAASGVTAAAPNNTAGHAFRVGADPAPAENATPAAALSGRAAVLAALTGAAGLGASAATASLKSKARGRSILEVAVAAAAAAGARPIAPTAGAPLVRSLPPWSQPALGDQDVSAACGSSSHAAHGRDEAEGVADVACCPSSQLSSKRRRATPIEPAAQPALLATSSASCCSGGLHHSVAACEHGDEGASGAVSHVDHHADSVPRAKRPRITEGVCELSPSGNVETVNDSGEAAREKAMRIDGGEERRPSASSSPQRPMSQVARGSTPAVFPVDWQRVVAVSEAKGSSLRRGIALLRGVREQGRQVPPPTGDEAAGDFAAARVPLTVDQQFCVLTEATEHAATEVWHGQSAARRLLRQRSQLMAGRERPAPPASCRPEAAASPLPPLTQASTGGLVGSDGVETVDVLEGATGAGSVTAAALGDAAIVGPAGGALAYGLSAASAAEAALTRTLHQAQFRQMSGRVFGQFNRGFIIASVGGGDVYIVDQHASHEKARYEHLMASTVMHEQRLLLPRPIDLTAGEEGVVLDHMPTFNSNGFHFAVDMAQPPGRRLRLSAVPFSRGVTFGDEDVRELASVLAEGAGSGEQIVRIPKTAAVFASRACRSAVMIGDPLSLDRMRSIVAGLAQLHQPWNCPHGRPTLRHLVDLSRLPSALSPAGSDQALAPLDVEAVDGERGVAGCVTARQAAGQDDDANGDELGDT